MRRWKLAKYYAVINRSFDADIKIWLTELCRVDFNLIFR